MGAVLRLSLLCAALAAPARGASAASAPLPGIDVYRSKTVSRGAAARRLGPLARRYLARLAAGRPARPRAEKLRAELLAGMSRLGDFAYVGVNVGRSVSASATDVTVTFDVVDAQDAAERMPFGRRPSGRLPDPGGLLAQWRRYWALCSALRQKGEPVAERPACPALYCPWVQRTDAVRELESRFQREVPARAAELARVLAQQAEPRERVAAAYLLAFSSSAPAAVESLLGAVKDPDGEVRAAALSVLADVAAYRKDVFIDGRRVLPALDFPTTLDRSKALAVFAGLAGNPQYRGYIASRAALPLVRLLQALDPSVRGLAHTVLGMVSERNDPSEDLDSWQKWAREQAARAPEKKEDSNGTERR
jgi:hypothetical protein